MNSPQQLKLGIDTGGTYTGTVLVDDCVAYLASVRSSESLS